MLLTANSYGSIWLSSLKVFSPSCVGTCVWSFCPGGAGTDRISSFWLCKLIGTYTCLMADIASVLLVQWVSPSRPFNCCSPITMANIKKDRCKRLISESQESRLIIITRLQRLYMNRPNADWKIPVKNVTVKPFFDRKPDRCSGQLSFEPLMKARVTRWLTGPMASHG
jgi:hypothetical protein